MYRLAVKRDFIGQHFLIGGDWGKENQVHSHHFEVEVLLEGSALNEHGYLVDILDLEAALQTVIERYTDHTFNELPEFVGLNPSVERLVQFMAQSISASIAAPNISALTVTAWETPTAWASYRVDR